MTEKEIEQYLRDRVKAIGGKAYKFISPGNDGVPDRLICFPGGYAAFVELKAPGKEPTALQRMKHRELRRLGFLVYGKVDSREDVDIVIDHFISGRTVTAWEIVDLEMADIE